QLPSRHPGRLQNMCVPVLVVMPVLGEVRVGMASGAMRMTVLAGAGMSVHRRLGLFTRGIVDMLMAMTGVLRAGVCANRTGPSFLRMHPSVAVMVMIHPGPSTAEKPDAHARHQQPARGRKPGVNTIHQDVTGSEQSEEAENEHTRCMRDRYDRTEVDCIPNGASGTNQISGD